MGSGLAAIVSREGRRETAQESDRARGRRSGLGRIAHHQIWSGRRRDLSTRADVAPNERAGVDHRFQTATVSRRFAQTRFESEAAGGMVPCLEVERSSGRVVGEQRGNASTERGGYRSGGRDRAGEEFFYPVARSQAD